MRENRTRREGVLEGVSESEVIQKLPRDGRRQNGGSQHPRSYRNYPGVGEDVWEGVLESQLIQEVPRDGRSQNGGGVRIPGDTGTTQGWEKSEWGGVRIPGDTGTTQGLEKTYGGVSESQVIQAPPRNGRRQNGGGGCQNHRSYRSYPGMGEDRMGGGGVRITGHTRQVHNYWFISPPPPGPL